MRSGYDNYQGIWGNPFYDNQFAEIDDRVFVRKTYQAADALVSIGPVDPLEIPKSCPARFYEDGTVEIPYTGQPFDAGKFKVVKDNWSHEHCCVCQFSIQPGHSFWVNAAGSMLCDECHDHYIKADERG